MKNLLRRQARELAAVQRQQAREFATAQRELKRETARRKALEAALLKSREHYQDLLKQSKTAREEKILLARRVLLTQEEERRQISRALHDEISQTLAGINIRLSALTLDPAAANRSFRAKIMNAQKLVEKAVDVVHRFARDLRPTLLDDLGLIPALHAYMKIITRRTGLQINFTAFPDVEKLSNARRTALFRVAQSALTNVMRHAAATQVEVTLSKAKPGTLLEIGDNGKAFDVEKVLHKGFKRLGILSMRERIEMLGGTFSIESAPGKGTWIRAFVPPEKRKTQP